MASRIDVRDIKEWLKFLPTRYVVRLLPIVVIIAAVGWFFLLRSPSEPTNTSGTTGTAGATPETTANTTNSGTQPEDKIADNTSTLTKTTTEKDKTEDGKLPETGPADTLGLFVIAAVAGTLFWEWRLRHVRTSQN